MSQIFKDLSSGPVPPDVPTDFVTDDGTAIPAANILNFNGGFSTENNDNGILTAADPDMSDNMFVVLTNRLGGSQTTIGAVTADVITFSLGATPGCYKFHFEVTAFEDTTPAGLGYSIEASARTDGAAATIISTPDADEDEDVALNTADWDVIASGNNVILRVTGVAALDVNWKSIGYYIFIS